MATVELQRLDRTQNDLGELARSLAALTLAAREYPCAVKQVSRGFLELSALARRHGESRICMASRAMSSILEGLERAPEGDTGFILDTAVNFLETVSSRNEMQTSVEAA